MLTAVDMLLVLDVVVDAWPGYVACFDDAKFVPIDVVSYFETQVVVVLDVAAVRASITC